MDWASPVKRASPAKRDDFEQVLITYMTRAHAQLFVTLLPQAVSQTFRHI